MRPTSQPPPKFGPPSIGASVPPGRGWWCTTDSPNPDTVHCVRSRAECNQTREALGSKYHSECTYADVAYCYETMIGGVYAKSKCYGGSRSARSSAGTARPANRGRTPAANCRSASRTTAAASPALNLVRDSLAAGERALRAWRSRRIHAGALRRRRSAAGRRGVITANLGRDR